jgi:hypothetical protein
MQNAWTREYYRHLNLDSNVQNVLEDAALKVCFRHPKYFLMLENYVFKYNSHYLEVHSKYLNLSFECR